MTLSALPTSFFSVVVRRDGVAERFPGGCAAFDAAVQPARSNGDLSVLVTMSMDDADLVFSRLHQAGLRPGEDFGLVDMQQGALLPCHGVRTIGTERCELVFEWAVSFDPAYRYLPEDVRLEWSAAATSPEVVPVTPRSPHPPSPPHSASGRRWEPGVGVRGGGLVHRFGGDDDEE